MIVRNVGGRLVDIPDSIIEAKNLLGRQMAFTPTEGELEDYKTKEEAIRQRQIDKALGKAKALSIAEAEILALREENERLKAEAKSTSSKPK